MRLNVFTRTQKQLELLVESDKAPKNITEFEAWYKPFAKRKGVLKVDFFHEWHESMLNTKEHGNYNVPGKKIRVLCGDKERRHEYPAVAYIGMHELVHHLQLKDSGLEALPEGLNEAVELQAEILGLEWAKLITGFSYDENWVQKGLRKEFKFLMLSKEPKQQEA